VSRPLAPAGETGRGAHNLRELRVICGRYRPADPVESGGAVSSVAMRAISRTEQVSDGGETTAGELLELIDSRPDWHALAACHQPHPGVTWFPVRGEAAAPARKVCATCLARPDCLAWALDQGPELDGVWAGTTKHDRSALRTGRGQAA
jgi:WhiB family redox-sensing transcriptional regulator